MAPELLRAREREGGFVVKGEGERRERERARWRREMKERKKRDGRENSDREVLREDKELLSSRPATLSTCHVHVRLGVITHSYM
jgi:hypothetical protein